MFLYIFPQLPCKVLLNHGIRTNPLKPSIVWENYLEALVASKYTVNMPAIPEGKEQKGPTNQIKMLILHIYPLNKQTLTRSKGKS